MITRLVFQAAWPSGTGLPGDMFTRAVWHTLDPEGASKQYALMDMSQAQLQVLYFALNHRSIKDLTIGESLFDFLMLTCSDLI